MKRVIIIDALNAYFRAFIVNPSLSVHGHPIGGLKGFLGILQKLCRDIKPDTVMIIWDGPGGSRKRREQMRSDPNNNLLLVCAFREVEDEYYPYNNDI